MSDNKNTFKVSMSRVLQTGLKNKEPGQNIHTERIKVTSNGANIELYCFPSGPIVLAE